MLPIKPQRMLEYLRALAEFGKLGTGVNRRSLTPEDLAARDWLLERMRSAGLEAEIDGIGSLAGRTPGSRRHILIGSHTDSVPKGGWLDGSMGVIFGLEIARAWVESGRSDDLGIEVISFIDEEGRFAGLLGSAAFTGKMAERKSANSPTSGARASRMRWNRPATRGASCYAAIQSGTQPTWRRISNRARCWRRPESGSAW